MIKFAHQGGIPPDNQRAAQGHYGLNSIKRGQKSSSRRVDTSGVEVNVTDIQSPPSKKMNKGMPGLAMRNVKAGNFESTTECIYQNYDRQYQEYAGQKLQFPPIVDTEADENIKDRSSEELRSTERGNGLESPDFVLPS